MNYSIGVIGAGNMGGAIIEGLLSDRSRSPEDIIVCDPDESILEGLSSAFPGINVSRENTKAVTASMLVLAVKPQLYESVIREICRKIKPDTIIVSIAAGLTIERISGWFGGTLKIVRTMPNTPALVAAGMTALCPGPEIDDDELLAVQSIFDDIGKTILLPEHLMDVYTSLAGSSPAWVFMFIEALADGAVRDGFPRSMAYKVAAQAVMGAAQLVEKTGKHPGDLKDQVCSPGGITIEAVATLEAAGFRSAVIQAISDCTRKAREL